MPFLPAFGEFAVFEELFPLGLVRLAIKFLVRSDGIKDEQACPGKRNSNKGEPALRSNQEPQGMERSFKSPILPDSSGIPIVNSV